ncbi:AroM family protein [Amycolatopsis sp. VS8301801F10]|uniref:AroM family protein n=1 Tax=Amycolatopsis sp. VS8301801F10 TaxID=2652442 RepID=UPI0038FBEC0E
MRTLGVVTIGQTPRADVTAELEPLLPPCRIVEHGALDGLDAEALAALRPGPGQASLATTLAGGRPVVYRHEAAEPLVGAAVRRAEEDGADVVLLACGGAFGALAHRKPLLRTEILAQQGVRALAGGMRVGVLRPLAGQVEEARLAWRRALGTDQVVVDAVNPFDARPADLAAAAAGLTGRCDVLVLDCFGFGERMRAAAAREFGGPVLLIRSVAARLTAEFLAGV